MPALASFVLSMLFTLFAIDHPDAARGIALPVACLVLAGMAWQAHKNRSRA